MLVSLTVSDRLILFTFRFKQATFYYACSNGVFKFSLVPLKGWSALFFNERSDYEIITGLVSE